MNSINRIGLAVRIGRLRSLAPLALVLISALLAACNNGSGGSGY